MSRPVRFALLAALVLSACHSTGFAQEIVRGPGGMVAEIKFAPIPPAFLNPTTREEDAAFYARCREVLARVTKNADGSFKTPRGGTFFENEKAAYPSALMHLLAGNAGAGMQTLQAEDDAAGSWHRHTEGIDLFPGFTIVGQTAKYFFTRELMKPDYRARMERGFANWTKTHPRFTPHPVFQKFDPKKEGWGPDRFGNSQVDVRRTDAMWGFTMTSVYLFAEAAGNEATRKQAKDQILRYAWDVFHVGVGEWESSTYLPYSVAPYLNLHAYAKDAEVRMAAKLVLDAYHVVSALKYRRGLFSGASKRDYGNAYVAHSGGFNGYFPVIFGDAPDVGLSGEGYLAYAMISPYRPSAGMLALARRKLDKPVEVLSTKPTYEMWKMPAAEGPSFFETQFLARSYDLSSVVSAGGADDIAPFRLIVDREGGGADAFVVNSRAKLAEKFAGDSLAQYRNLLVWVSPPPSGDAAFHFALPPALSWRQDGDWAFLKGAKTWVALRTFGLGAAEARAVPADQEKAWKKNLGGSTLRIAARRAEQPGGFALIVAEAGDYASFEAFQSAVKGKAKLDVSGLAEGVVTLTGPDGESVGVKQSRGLPEVWRDGVKRDWADPASRALFRSVDSDLLSLGWKEGVLKLNAGGASYEGRLALEGFAGENAAPADVEGAKGLVLKAGFAPTAK